MSTTTRATFVTLVGVVLERFYQQNGRPPLPPRVIRALGRRLWELVEERGLPRPLEPGEQGEPRDWPAEEVAPLVAQVLGPDADPDDALRATAARQLVKACFQPPFRTCRNSYREEEPDGTRRRQDLARVRGRVSGSHCVDCPHWLALERDAHAKFLARAWRPEGAAELAANREVFLPEDFRVLRRFLHAQARI